MFLRLCRLHLRINTKCIHKTIKSQVQTHCQSTVYLLYNHFASTLGSIFCQLIRLDPSQGTAEVSGKTGMLKLTQSSPYLFSWKGIRGSNSTKRMQNCQTGRPSQPGHFPEQSVGRMIWACLKAGFGTPKRGECPCRFPFVIQKGNREKMRKPSNTEKNDCAPETASPLHSASSGCPSRRCRSWTSRIPKFPKGLPTEQASHPTQKET